MILLENLQPGGVEGDHGLVGDTWKYYLPFLYQMTTSCKTSNEAPNGDNFVITLCSFTDPLRSDKFTLFPLLTMWQPIKWDLIIRVYAAQFDFTDALDLVGNDILLEKFSLVGCTPIY